MTSVELASLITQHHKVCHQVAELVFDHLIFAYRSTSAVHKNAWRAHQLVNANVEQELERLWAAQCGEPYPAVKCKSRSQHHQKIHGLSEQQCSEAVNLTDMALLELEVLYDRSVELLGRQHRLCVALGRVETMLTGLKKCLS